MFSLRGIIPPSAWASSIAVDFSLARLDLPFISHDSFGPNFASLFFLLPAFAFDLATRGRLHPALGYGALAMILLLPLRLWLKTLL